MVMRNMESIAIFRSAVIVISFMGGANDVNIQIYKQPFNDHLMPKAAYLLISTWLISLCISLPLE